MKVGKDEEKKKLRAPPIAANHYFVLKCHLRLRLFWAVAPSSQADLCII